MKCLDYRSCPAVIIKRAVAGTGFDCPVLYAANRALMRQDARLLRCGVTGIQRTGGTQDAFTQGYLRRDLQ
jgi:hypothetical protein